MSDISVNATTSSSTSSTSASSSVTPSSSSSSFNVIRLTGLASGLDVDKLVEASMSPYQARIDQEKQDIQKLQWKQQAYTTIINDIKDLQDTYFNVASPDMNILSASFFNVMAAASDNSTIVVSADSTAQAGNYSISVGNLATAASVSGGSLNSQVSFSDDPNNWFGHSITFSEGNPIALTADGNTNDVAGVVAEINKKIAADPSLSGKISASYVTDSSGTNIKFTNLSSDSIKITGSDIQEINAGYNPGDSTTYNIQNGMNLVSINSNTLLSQLVTSPDTVNPADTFDITYNGTSYTVKMSKTDGTETLGQLAADISNATSGKVTAKIDDITGKFIIQSSSTGSGNTVSVSDSTSGNDDILHALKITSGTSGNGGDASVTINNNGTSLTLSESTNNFTLNGITYKFTKPNSTANVTVTSDADKVFDKFQGFMKKYNSIVTEIKTKITEKVDYDYPPLTDAQKSQMSQSDIDLWNQKAQQGILHDDDNLSNMLYSLKNIFYTDVNGVSAYLGKSIGLDMSADYSSDGTIVFYDGTGDKFKQMLEDNNSDVVNFFTQTAPANDTKDEKTGDEGVFQRINDLLVSNVGMTGVTSTESILGAMANKQDDYSEFGTSGTNTLPDQLYQENLKLLQLQSDYDDKRTAYYNQYTTLETVMSQLNSQQSYLSQLFSS